MRDLGVEYLRPLIGLTVFFYLNMLFAAALRAVGNTMLPFMIALFTNVLNIVLNYGLIFGRLGLPAMGVRGAAWGTVIAQAVAVILMVLLLRRGVVYGMRAHLRLNQRSRGTPATDCHQFRRYPHPLHETQGRVARRSPYKRYA